MGAGIAIHNRLDGVLQRSLGESSMLSKRRCSILLPILLAILSLGLGPQDLSMGSRALAQGEPLCRFGVTVPGSLTGFESKFSELRVGAYMDWAQRVSPEHPNGAEYLQVLRVGPDETTYLNDLAAIPSVAAANPGSFWSVGNEPDAPYGQDNIPAELYAERYYEMATLIRSHDPSARIGFGSIVQPSPLRTRYLERAWNRLIELAGSREAASALIDFWNLHVFILNEQKCPFDAGYWYPADYQEWGAGIPQGFEWDCSDAYDIEFRCVDQNPDGSCNRWDAPETHDITIFQQQIIDFRGWMASEGERNKPLWLTEYGSLFPEFYVPRAETAQYMTDTFEFLLSATDPNTGYPYDGNRLVQGWFWNWLYDAQSPTINYGGDLYYYASGNRTPEGDAFVNYVSGISASGDPFPADLSAMSAGGSDYTFTITIANQGNAPFTGGYDVALFLGDPDAGGLQLGTTLSQPADLRGCGEFHRLSLTTPLSDPTPWDLYVRIMPALPANDADPSNNTQHFGGFRPQTFLDTPPSHPFWGSIETLYAAGYVKGCDTSLLRFCPDETLDRAEASVFVERGVHSAVYDPPDPSTQTFIDVPISAWYADWVEGLWVDGYTAGCGGFTPGEDLIYCPSQENTRAEGSVFFVRMLHGPSFTPPSPSTQIFDDVPLSEWYANWVHQAYSDGLIEPCQQTPTLLFCPDAPMSRGLAADMMVRAKGLTPLP